MDILWALWFPVVTLNKTHFLSLLSVWPLVGDAAFSGTQHINITLLKDKYHRLINKLCGCLCVPNCVAASLLLLDNGNYSVQFSYFSTSSCFSGLDKLLGKGGKKKWPFIHLMYNIELSYLMLASSGQQSDLVIKQLFYRNGKSLIYPWTCFGMQMHVQGCVEAQKCYCSVNVRFSIYTVQYLVFFNYSHDPFNLSFSNFSECGSSSRRLYLLSDLLALFLPVATLWLAEPCSEGIRLPHLQCGYGHGISAHRNVWSQRWVNVRMPGPFSLSLKVSLKLIWSLSLV